MLALARLLRPAIQLAALFFQRIDKRFAGDVPCQNLADVGQRELETPQQGNRPRRFDLPVVVVPVTARLVNRAGYQNPLIVVEGAGF